ncbi:MAG: extracellular solute-binding protein [Anaerolinea sp.]|nr:extracellular solute-binding protein [Anaerolinea sp.]
MFSNIRTGLLLVIVLLLVLVPAVVTAQDKVTIEVWLYDDDLGQCVSDLVTAGFNAYSETAQVNVTLQPDVYTTLGTALAGGGGPDVVPIDGPVAAQQIASAGLLLPLDGYVVSEGWDTSFVPWALELGKVDGQLYTLPDSLETLLIWYNSTLFETNGWEIPTTMDEFFALMQTISDAGIIPLANAFGDYPPAHEWLVGAFLNHYAGPEMVYEALTGQREWTDPVFLEAITQLNTMVQNGWVDGGLDTFFTDSFDTVHAMVGSGEAAMTLEGSWFFPTQYFGAEAGNDNEFNWFPFPTSSGDEVYMTGIGAAWGINANTEHPEAAVEFLSWLFSPAAQAERLTLCGFALAPIQISADAFAETDPRVAQIYSRYGEAAAQGNYGYTTWTFFPSPSQIYLYEQIQNVYLGDLTPEAYLAGLAELFAQDLADGSVPPIPAR